MSYVLAVANQKGGVAKTTTVASLGGALVRLGKQVLMIDLDAQADLTLAMGLLPKQVRGSAAEIFLNSTHLGSLCRETAIVGLDLLPANSEMDLAERFLSVRKNYELILRQALSTQLPGSLYDFILLDCPPALGAVTYNALLAADMVLIPTQPEYFSVHALKSMMAAVKRARNSGNSRLQYRVLITMQDLRNRVHRNLSQELQTAFGDSLFQTVIEVDTKLRESALAGLPISHYLARTRSALQYQALAQELIEYARQETVQTAA